ncbi:hypothetical protein GCM10022221_04720 [Actinocorallia aurea]
MMRTVIMVSAAAGLLAALAACGGESDTPEKTPEPVRSVAGLPQELIGPWQVAEGEGSYEFVVDGTWTWSEPGCQAAGGYTAEASRLALTVSREGCGREAGDLTWKIADARLTLTRPDGQAEVYVRPQDG